MEGVNTTNEDPSDTNLVNTDGSEEQIKIKSKRFPKMTVEPAIFLAMIGSNMCGILLTNLLMTRTCEYMELKNCSEINSDSAGPNEEKVQPYVASLGMYKLMYESLVPSLLAFFLGPWSDTYGRRPLMLAPLLGYCFNFLLLIGFTWFNLAPIYIILTSTPLVLLGGSMTFFTGAFCYVTDISPKEDLSYRLALAEGMLYLGILCGNTAAPYLYSLIPSHGYEVIFGISFLFCLISLLYVAFLIPESLSTPEVSKTERLKALFDIRQVVDLFRVCFGNHEGHSRPTRLILVLVTLLSLLSIEGTIVVSYLFIRKRFSWDVKEFSIYVDAAFLMNISGVLFGTIVFSKWAKLPNVPLSCFGYFVKAIGYVIGGLGDSGWYMYLSSAVGGLGGMTSPLNRAIIAETVPKRDIGKLFSIISAFMTATPILAALLYVSLYNHPMNTFPGAVYLLSAGLSAICCLLLGSVIIIRQTQDPHPYMLADDNPDQDSEHVIS